MNLFQRSTWIFSRYESSIYVPIVTESLAWTTEYCSFPAKEHIFSSVLLQNMKKRNIARWAPAILSLHWQRRWTLAMVSFESDCCFSLEPLVSALQCQWLPDWTENYGASSMLLSFGWFNSGFGQIDNSSRTRTEESQQSFADLFMSSWTVPFPTT